MRKSFHKHHSKNVDLSVFPLIASSNNCIVSGVIAHIKLVSVFPADVAMTTAAHVFARTILSQTLVVAVERYGGAADLHLGSTSVKYDASR